MSRIGAVLLSDRDIRAAIDTEELGIEPFDSELIQPSSVDVRLDKYFRVFNNSRYTHIDPKEEMPDLTTLVEVEEDQSFILHPGEFVLGATLEKFTLPADLAGRLEGKSSLGRLGLLTHSTAGFIDPGFSGHITLELSNTANLPIALWPGMKVGAAGYLQDDFTSGKPIWHRLAGLEVPGSARTDAIEVLPEFSIGLNRHSHRASNMGLYAYDCNRHRILGCNPCCLHGRAWP